MTKSTRNTTTDLQTKDVTSLATRTAQDELTIHIKSTMKHENVSASSNGRKAIDPSQLLSVLQETLNEKGENQIVTDHLIGSNEVEFQKGKLSYSTLHSFLLKAEQMGKKVTYEKVYTVKISD
ncbi:hypothetical protein [Flammeovirga sp. SJP92]|uniref:hypothetical protein n=1 Tax=Flammeovirga sp. SJP92 TaxID=1775430 RepID=UPI000787E5F8|nr:hypothetical protein [Flammeovirga sp. SJP92]KXX71258.1 hypothetical protein AVL50_09380 [Flammeovirga sp. SJP92]